jgi:hypothetical protein
MITEELKKYVQESFISGKTDEDIKQTLLKAGWQEADVREVFQELGITKDNQIQSRNRIQTKQLFIYSTFVCIIAVLGSVIFYLWQDRINLSEINNKKVREFYTRIAHSQISFTDAGELVFPDEQRFITQKNYYIQNKVSFVEANLRTMELTLYENGAVSKKMKILAKGKQGSWWETPTGNYKVLGKSINSYSSIGNVWMPYSVQFYGNYFIHGWPYYDEGTPVSQSYSGGCIRLSTEDAWMVFNFVNVGMPVLVLENIEERNFGVLISKFANTPPPAISSKAFLISNLASGETILEKNAQDKLPIASLTKLMTAVVAHETIYLGRSIRVTPSMLASVSQIFYPTAGEYYLGLDLLYPLLMQSSNDAAKILSEFVGEKTFVQNMNAKAISLQMTDTQFADASGISAQNISTAYDMSKLLQYIYYKRPFLFDITRGVAFENIGLIKTGETINITKLKNFNEFVENPDLIGVKNGETNAARQTMATVWNIRTPQGEVPVAIIVLKSENRKRDTEILLKWLKDNFVTL